MIKQLFSFEAVPMGDQEGGATTRFLIDGKIYEGRYRTVTPAEIDSAAGVTELRQQVITLEAKLKMRAGIDDPLISNLASELKEAREQRDRLLDAAKVLVSQFDLIDSEFDDGMCACCKRENEIGAPREKFVHDEGCGERLLEAAISACRPKVTP